MNCDRIRELFTRSMAGDSSCDPEIETHMTTCGACTDWMDNHLAVVCTPADKQDLVPKGHVDLLAAMAKNQSGVF